jgi:cobalt-zinc-cadmium efflux system outer membrane protein
MLPILGSRAERMRTILLYTVAGLVLAQAAAAQTYSPTDSLTAERVVALARAAAPRVRAAESRVQEARARLNGAQALGRENPTFEGVAATEGEERRTEWMLTVPLQFGVGRSSGIGVARAELNRDLELLADARRGAAGAALAGYYRVLHATSRAALARERLEVAREIRRTAHERHRAGDVPRLELLLTETEEARAESELLSEEQGMSRERMALAMALGLPSGAGLPVAGALADRGLLTRTLAAPPTPRADVLAAEQELRASGSSRTQAKSEILPGLEFLLHYDHEDGASVVKPGVGVTVPLFQRGQESRGTAGARESRARADLEAARNAAAVEAEGFEHVYEGAILAAERLAEGAIPRVEESERMIRESYAAGKIDLPAMLFVRRDLLDARREYLDRLLEAALAAIDLAAARGHFQQ